MTNARLFQSARLFLQFRSCEVVPASRVTIIFPSSSGLRFPGCPIVVYYNCLLDLFDALGLGLSSVIGLQFGPRQVTCFRNLEEGSRLKA